LLKQATLTASCAALRIRDPASVVQERLRVGRVLWLDTDEGTRLIESILTAMNVVERLVRLWTEPVAASAEALAAFNEAYSDPVSINGVDVPLADLVERARRLQRAFADLRMELIERIETPGRVVIVFWQRGRHVGPLETPLGEISPTGREVEIRVIDVLSISDGRISAIQVVPDNLGLAMQLGAVQLVQRRKLQ
jgi:ketosteroid isomerase-like protein